MIVILWIIILYIYSTSISETVPSEFTDEQVLRTYYSDIKTHSWFYSEEKWADNYFSKYDPNNPYKSPVYCWSNMEEAKTIAYPIILSWGEFYEKIYNEEWTEKYFQFETQDKFNSRAVIFRIDNCNYIERISRFWTWEIWVFKKIPLSKDSVKELSEYLWFEGKYTSWWVWTINSTISEDSNYYYSEIYYVSWVGWDWWVNDKIKLIQRITSVNKESWKISLDEKIIKTVVWKNN